MRGYMTTKRKKRLAMVVNTLLLAGSLLGCGQKGNASGAAGDMDEVERGAYVEKELPLTGIPEGVALKQLYTVDDKLHLVTAEEGESGFTLQEWELQKDAFTEVTGNWLAELVIPGESWSNIELMQDGSGVQYLFYRLIDRETDTSRGYLWRGEGDEARDITPEKWTVVNEEYGIYEYINGIAALDNGTLAAASFLSADRINGEDGSVLDSEPVTGGYMDGMISDGENVYRLSLSMTGTVEEVEKWVGGSLKNAETLSFGQDSYGVELCALPDGTLISADDEGIFRCEAGTQDWKRLLSGLETSFSLTEVWCADLAALQDGRIYALFHGEGNTSKLLLYEYDPEAVPVVSTVLKMYAVEESYLLQNAAALYHRAHPDVRIELEYSYSMNDRYSDTRPDYNAVYQQVNTMLMGSEAPDILVLDHLNKESLAEKGVLAEIQDIIAPMEESGALLSNITGAYRQEDGRQYIVPLQFGFSLAVGRDISVQDMATMESLAAFLGGKQESYMGSRTVSELVDEFAPYFSGLMVKDKELDREVLSEYLQALKQIAGNCGIIEKREEKRHYNMWELAYLAKFEITDSDGFNDSMFPLAIADYIKGEFTCFENAFTPYMEMGISAKSEYQDVARDFLAFCLSNEVQRKDYYSGYSVNVDCLETLAAADRSELAASTTIEIGEGVEEPFTINDYSQETAQKLLAVCKELDHPVKEDEKIREVLTETLPAYLQGIQSLEETMDKIEGGLRMYLAE